MRTVALVIAATLTLGLTSCAAEPLETAAPPDSTATEKPEPTPDPQPEAIVIAVDSLSIVRDDGSTVETAFFTDAESVLDLVAGVLGPVPEPELDFFGAEYTWSGGLTVSIAGPVGDTLADAVVVFEAGSIDGLALRTVDGIHVGSSRDEVIPLDPVAVDGDGDGDVDQYGLNPVEKPGTESLTHPGSVGTAWVTARMAGDAVIWLAAEGGDFHDV